MNWFLLLLLLKALTVNWAAPIDLLETNNELQQYKEILDNTVNKTSDAADQAKNLIKTLENLVNSKNLDETVQKVSQNLTGDIRNQLEQSPVNVNENQQAPEESNENESAFVIPNIFAPKDEMVPRAFQNPVESLTEYNEALQDTKNVSNDNEYQQFSASTNAPEYISSTSSIDIESGVTDKYFTTPENKENLTKFIEIAENAEQHLSKSGEDAEQVTAQSVNIVKQTTLDLKAPNFTSVVDSFIEDIVEFGSKLGFIPEEKQNEQISTTTEMFKEHAHMKVISLKDNKFKEEGISTTSISRIEEESLESQVGKIKEITLTMEEPKTTTSSPLESFNETQENHTEMDQYTRNLTFLKEPYDSLINQVADIDSNIHKEFEKLVTESSVIPPATDNSNNPESAISTKENFTEMPFNLNPNDTSVQLPSFTTAIDSFIEDIVEFGSKLGLIPEEKRSEQISTTTETFTEHVNMEGISLKENKHEEEARRTTSISSMEQSLESQVGKIKEITVAIEEPKTTTSSLLESFNETQENHNEIDQYSKNSTFLKETVNSLIHQVADIPSKIQTNSQKWNTESAVIPQPIDNSDNPDSAITTKENSTEMPFNLKPDDTSARLPSFTTAIDSFIEDIVEFGSKLGLIQEEKQNEQIPTTTEIFTENVNISLKENKLEEEASSTSAISNVETTQDLKSKIISTVENVDKNLESLQDTSQKLIENVFDNITENLEPSASETDFATVRNTDEFMTETANENFAEKPLQNVEQSIAPNNNDTVKETTNIDQEENSDKLHSLKENIDSLINPVADIDSNIQKDSKKLLIESSVIQEATGKPNNSDSPITIKANITEMTFNLKQTPSFATAVDSFIEDIAEIGSKLGLIPEEKQNEQIPIANENFSQHVNMEGISLKENIHEAEGSGSTPISIREQSFESQFGIRKEITLPIEEPQTTASPLWSFNETREQQTEINQYPKNSSFLKESIDSSISQGADIDSKINKESEKLVTEYSVIPQATDNSNNSDNSANTTKENFTEMPFNHKPDDTSVQAPSFTTAVDSFIEDIVEFDSKLGLIPEVKENEQIPTTPDILNLEGISIKENKHEEEDSSTKPISNIESTPNLKSKTISTTQSIVKQLDENLESLQDPSQKLIENVFDNITEYLEPSASETDFATVRNTNETLAAKTYEYIDTDKSYKFFEYFTEQPPVIQEATNKSNNSDLPITIEEKQHEQISTTTEIFSELENIDTITLNENKLEREGSSATSISSIELSLEPQVEKIKETTLTMEEPKATTTTPLEKFNETQENKIEMDQYSKNSNYSKSLENVADAIVEIGSNIGKSFTDFLSPNKSNESLTEMALSEQQNIMENPSTDFKFYTKEDFPETSSEETTKTLEQDLKSIDIPVITQTSSGIFLNPSENLSRTFNGNVELRESNDKDILVLESPRQGKVEKDFEEDEVRPEKHPAKYVDYIALEAIPNAESETRNTSTVQQSEINLKATPTNEEKTDDIQESKVEVTEVKLVEIETSNGEDSENTSPTTEIATTIKESSKTDDYTTSHPLIQEIFPSLNKIETILKPLIEKGTFKQEDVYNTNLEPQQLETSTSTPNTILSTTLKDELTTMSPIEETTVLPKKLEEELQIAVKALEETTHHHFEEFQNNLKEAIKKFTVWGVEHERQEETSTLKNLASEATTTESGIKEQPLKELSATIKPEEELTSENNVQVEESVKLDESHRSGAVRQNFFDKFAVNYKDSLYNAELQTEKPLPKLQESEFGNEHITETPKVLTTVLPTVMEDEVAIDVKDANVLVQITTIQNEVVEATTVRNTNTDESTSAVEEVPTEYIAEATSAPLLTRVSLQKDTNSFSLKKVFEIVTEVTAQEPTTQHLDTDQTNHTNSEITPTTQTIEETTTLQTPENSLQEMATFIEYTETTTNSHPTEKDEVRENFATAKKQVPLTQASFMKEQQQQIESTTEHEAQTQTAAENEQAFTIQQQTTEAEIHSTTGVEETETTVAPVEQEARSLSLPPPKLEYLQNEDGVEIFYGYSIVKRN